MYMCVYVCLWMHIYMCMHTHTYNYFFNKIHEVDSLSNLSENIYSQLPCITLC